MRQNKSSSMRGSVTQNNISVRMRANDKSSLGFLTRLGLLAAAFLIFAGIAVLLWRAGWPQQQAENLYDTFLTVTQKAQFAVKDIAVEGRHRAAKADIFDALGTERGAPILAFDSKAAAARLAKLPWVESATIERHLPDAIVVTLVEREPSARWQHDDHLYVVDGQGHVLPAAQAEEFPTLPLIVGAGANDQFSALFDALKTYPAIQAQVESVVRVGERRWDLHLQSKAVIKLPEDDGTGAPLTGALHRLSVLISQDKILDRDVASIDLRVPDRLVVEPVAAPAAPSAGGKHP